jgi:hypothetical protein
MEVVTIMLVERKKEGRRRREINLRGFNEAATIDVGEAVLDRAKKLRLRENRLVATISAVLER